MFHYKDNINLITNTDRKLINSTFKKYSTSTDKQTLNKTDFKTSWLYLFGYKPSKVSFFCGSILIVFVLNTTKTLHLLGSVWSWTDIQAVWEGLLWEWTDVFGIRRVHSWQLKASSEYFSVWVHYFCFQIYLLKFQNNKGHNRRMSQRFFDFRFFVQRFFNNRWFQKSLLPRLSQCFTETNQRRIQVC